MTKEEKIAKLNFLIKDEYEAVDGYKETISKLDTEEDWRMIANLTEIQEEELEHIEELKFMLKMVQTEEIEPIQIKDEVYTDFDK